MSDIFRQTALRYQAPDPLLGPSSPAVQRLSVPQDFVGQVPQQMLNISEEAHVAEPPLPAKKASLHDQYPAVS